MPLQDPAQGSHSITEQPICCRYATFMICPATSSALLSPSLARSLSAIFELAASINSRLTAIHVLPATSCRFWPQLCLAVAALTEADRNRAVSLRHLGSAAHPAVTTRDSENSPSQTLQLSLQPHQAQPARGSNSFSLCHPQGGPTPGPAKNQVHLDSVFLTRLSSFLISLSGACSRPAKKATSTGKNCRPSLPEKKPAAAMDEVAFVESLFAPEMRSAVASSLFPSSSPPCGRVKSLMAERSVPTPPSSNGVPPPPNSLLGGGIISQFQAPFQPPSEDTPLFVRLYEDDMFSQMLNDQDFPEFHFKKEHETMAKPPTSTNSLLLEPLDLPRSSDPSVKDTFYNMESSMYQQYKTPPSSSGGMRGISSASPSGFCVETSMMPVFPLTQGPYYSGFSTFPPTPTTQWMQEGQDVSTLASSNSQRVHTMKHMMAMASMGMSPMHQPSPGSVDMFNPGATSQQSLGLWISTRNKLPETCNGELKPSSMMKAPLDANKTSVERPPFSLTISPPASLTNKALKELIVSADFGAPPMISRPKRSRTDPGTQPKAKAARTTSASPVSQENNMGRANGKIMKGKKCIEAGCTRRAQSNSRCKAHGGGARCQYSGPGGCNRSSQGGGFCRAHGGGKRCEFPGCTRGQQRKGRCYVHGGIRKCQYGNCEKKDRGNGFCISHGGGKRCEHPGCSRAVRRGTLCQIHETQNAAEKEQGDSVAL